MPYKNIEIRRKYHKEYMNGYNKKHPLTLEQKKAKSDYMREWNSKNKARVKITSHKSYLKNKEKRAIGQKEYNDRNREQIKIRKRKYYNDNKEYFASKAKEYYKANKNIIREYGKQYAHRAISRFRTYKKSALVRGYEFKLTYQEFEELFNAKCHYCNLDQSKGVDRKDNNIGYTTENSLPCCKTCNYMKRDSNYDDFILQIKKIYSHLS